MPAKTKSIAAAEKRTIKAELKSLQKENRKIDQRTISEKKRIEKEIQKLNRNLDLILVSAGRELKEIHRRVRILLGRL